MRVAVLIPAHNEAHTIRAIVEGAARHAERVVVIDDGSTDGTSACLDGVRVEVIRHDQNGGKGRRLSEGLQHCFTTGADAVVTLDADGQHDVDDIPKLIAAATPDVLVLGDRTDDMARMPSSRSKANRVAGFFVSWACRQALRDTQCGMRLYPREAMQRITLDQRDRQHFVFETAVLMHAAEAGVRFVWVPIAARYQGFVHRPSHFRPVWDIVRITRCVGRFIIRRGFRPTGLLIALGWLR